jgi:hypothetical protein
MNVINEMNQWCANNSISQTPTLFLNGSKLPAIYSIFDILEFI